MRTFFLLIFVCVPLFATVPPPPGKSGAPGDGTCAECHTGAVTNPGRVIVDFTKIAYVPGQKQTIGVHILPSVDTPYISFQLTARLASNELQQAGTFSQSASAIRIDTQNGIQYVSGPLASRITVFEWTPPVNAGAVRFYVSAVAGTPGNNTADPNVYAASYTVQPATRDLPDGYRWQSIPLPATFPALTGLAGNGLLTGYHFPANNGNAVGFVRAPDGSFTPFQVTGATQTLPRAINSAGVVVGEYTDLTGTHGFFRTPDGTITLFQPALSGGLYSINDSGQVAGTLGNAAVTFSLAAPANFQLLDANSATGISANGNIVGRFNNSAYWRTTDGILRGVSMCSGGNRGTGFSIRVNNQNQIAGSCTASFGGGGSTNYFVIAENGRQTALGRVIDQTESGVILTQSEAVGAAETATPCSGSATTTSLPIAATGGAVNVPISASAGCNLLVTEESDWISGPGTASQAFSLSIQPNPSLTPRTATVRVGASTVTVTQAGTTCSYSLAANRSTIPSTGDAGGIGSVNATAGCPWEASTTVPWIILSGTSGNSSGNFGYTVLPNNGTQTRSGFLTVGDQSVQILQAGAAACTYAVTPQSLSIAQGGATGPIHIVTGAGCAWTASSPSPNITLAPQSGTGPATVTYTAGPNLAASSVVTQLLIAGSVVPVTQSGFANISLRYIPITPCRAVDTRGGSGGQFTPNETRPYTLPNLGCGIPASARAVAINLTAVPPAPLSFVTIFPTGQPRPTASTLNSFNGRVVANFAIVPLSNTGAVSVYTTDTTHILIDVMGYFVPRDTLQSLQFYPLAPCRVADTRTGGGTRLSNSARSFPMRGLCNIPPQAAAYAVNLTAVPPGPLAFISAWPTGQPQPTVSTLNAFDGSVVPNAAIIPAGANGEISLFASNETDVVIDVNGYFAPPAAGGLDFYPLSPCRVADTRVSLTTIPLQSTAKFYAAGCGAPANAQAYSLNFTAVPQGYLGFVTTYPGGTARPLASTLNSWNGQIVANAAIVPAGTDLSVEAFASNRTDVILDTNGYFAP